MLNFGTHYRHIGAYQPNNDLEPDGNWQWSKNQATSGLIQLGQW